ncbi:MAG: hypothetical protein [Circular genetic element sp.]|nr:MAG: hypothetical protein [Circular genetic element sp.]
MRSRRTRRRFNQARPRRTADRKKNRRGCGGGSNQRFRVWQEISRPGSTAPIRTGRWHRQHCRKHIRHRRPSPAAECTPPRATNSSLSSGG